MVVYLIKVTIVWLIMMLLYEALLHKTAKHTANRIYLIGSLLLGLMLPLLPFNLPTNLASLNNVPSLTSINVSGLAYNEVNVNANEIGNKNSLNLSRLVILIYWIGACILLASTLLEVGKILRKVYQNKYELINGVKVFSSTKNHAPFSFMGYLFIAQPAQYSSRELNYILKHEQAHNSRKHGFDLLLIQIVLIVFWFHPLVWRYRYLLKLAHEYEADELAAQENPFEYGHFLLQQLLLKGVPPIAHSFHFSPIKNRINMLTQNRTPRTWKYLAIVPALLCCTLLMANSNENSLRVKVGNKTTYKGNDFYWTNEGVDTVEIHDQKTSKLKRFPFPTLPSIYMVNSDSVYVMPSPPFPDIYELPKTEEIMDFLKSSFIKKVNRVSDSLFSIQLQNLVINSEGEVIYFDYYVLSGNGNKINPGLKIPEETEYANAVEEIVASIPKELLLSEEGIKNNRYVQMGPPIYFKATSFGAVKIN